MVVVPNGINGLNGVLLLLERSFLMAELLIGMDIHDGVQDRR